MNDEIKEILERVKKHYVLDEIQDNLLLNYITNLQEQLHQASLDIQELTERDIECPSWCDILTNLQQENQELNDSIKWWNNRFNAVQRDYEEYKSKIEKAVKIAKDLKQFVYDELVDRNVSGATETHVKIINLLNTLNIRSDE